MTEEPLRSCRTVTMTSERHLDKLCEEFDRAWRDGKKPRIEDWIDKVPEDERPVLFGLLARREKAFRSDETLVEEFNARFPGMSELIGALFLESTDFDVDLERPGPLPATGWYIRWGRSSR